MPSGLAPVSRMLFFVRFLDLNCGYMARVSRAAGRDRGRLWLVLAGRGRAEVSWLRTSGGRRRCSGGGVSDRFLRLSVSGAQVCPICWRRTRLPGRRGCRSRAELPWSGVRRYGHLRPVLGIQFQQPGGSRRLIAGPADARAGALGAGQARREPGCCAQARRCARWPVPMPGDSRWRQPGVLRRGSRAVPGVSVRPGVPGR